MIPSKFPVPRLATIWALALTLAIPLTLVVSPAAAGPWSFAAFGGGTLGTLESAYAKMYGVRESFDPTWLVQLAGERPLAGSLALRAEAGYIRYRQPVSLVSPFLTGGSSGPSWPSSGGELTTQFVPVALGVRLYSPDHGFRSRGYLQLAPAIFWLRGAERSETSTGGWIGGPPLSVTHGDDSFTALRPGMVAGAGVRTRLGARAHVEWGVRYLHSVPFGFHRLGQYSSRDYAGLNTLALAAGVGWRP